MRDDVRVRLQLLSGAWLPEEMSVERTIDQQPEHLLMLASLQFARLQKTLAEMGLAQVLDSALFLAGATPMAELRSEPIAQELAALDELLERASAAAIAVGSAHSVHESGHLLVLVRVVADALGMRSSSPTAAARILDNARNITVAREAAVRYHDECPPRPVVWPTEILQPPGGHEDAREIADVLPHAWVVCGLSIDRTRNLLFLTRYERGRAPAVLCLPMRALPAGLSDDPSGTVFDNAYAQMAAIIAESDQTMRVANECISDADKLQWWQQRTELDRRLGALLRSIEDEWLGGFRSLLLPIGAFAVGDPEAVGKVICACAESHVPMTNGVALADDVCRFVAYAARDADSDDWLDVCAMLLDMLCYRGGSMCSEDGISRFAADLKLALATDDQPTDAAAPRHLVLVLDKHAQQIPWESLPCLRSHSVSRVPSLSFLQQRLSKLQRSPPRLAGPLFDTLKGEKPALLAGSPAGVRVDGSHVYYVLNPAGDLARTQQNFEAYVRASSTWTGAIGRAPMDHELAQALASESAVLYFGHGGGEQYVSRARLRALPQCSVALLLGCSSGRLRPLGEYDAAGTALDYMVAGCPALLANLWDVGDKDIDRFAKSLLAKWGLGQVGVLGGTKTPGNMSLSEAVSEARGACRMPFLTGAAPVVYGIPAYIE
ncbi:hypothetical protein DL89DRAFT_265954 [Linderina pennispora]|uniref:separase n=1 Tax=Linderina pennispora TaxID=61395 RepID=A0A1Y1WGB9_9FUNG|nr:separase [Linderina pennispora]ORX72388.1 hypothetical protein DL89DRAFT_265954 [Linderina pennispora]